MHIKMLRVIVHSRWCCVCKPTPFHFRFESMRVQSQTPQTCPADSLTITSSYDSANVPYSASETNTSAQICRSWSVKRKRKHARYTNQLARLNHDKALNLGVYFHRFPLHDCRRSWVSLLRDQKGSTRENTNQTEGARGSFMRPVIFHSRRPEGCPPRYTSYLWTTDTHIHAASHFFLYI